MKNKEETKNWLELVITGFAAILVIFTFAFLIYELIYEKQTPPDISVTLGEILKKDEGYSVPVSVKNNGSQTAKGIVIEITSEENGTQEKGQITFDYLPGQSSVRGWVTFTIRPASSTLKSQVLGYAIP